MFSRRPAVLLLPLVLMLAFVLGPSAATAPTSATIAGDLQSELGCPGDWAPDCTATDLTPTDGVFVRSFTVPTGNWQYKVALNHSWDESYGAHTGSDNILLAGTGASVTFAFDPVTHWVADSVNALIVTAPGSYQSELGCSGDWQPDCLKTWLEDPDGDGVYTFETRSIPPGSYETKAAINRSWDVNYGAGGAPGGANIAFTVSAPNQRVIFSFDSRDSCPVDPGRTRRRRQRRVGRAPLRFPRHALSHAARRGSPGHADDAPVPHVPRRRDGRHPA